AGQNLGNIGCKLTEHKLLQRLFVGTGHAITSIRRWQLQFNLGWERRVNTRRVKKNMRRSGKTLQKKLRNGAAGLVPAKFGVEASNGRSAGTSPAETARRVGDIEPTSRVPTGTSPAGRCSETWACWV